MSYVDIGGLQKTTILDFPGKIACTVFTKGCKFRCPYCHNSSLVIYTEENTEIPEENFFSFLEKRKGILEGVCISGGEPLLQEGIEEWIRKIKEMGYLVKLDTNGYYPKKLKELIEKDLIDYVAMDIKSSPKNYAKAVGLNLVDLEKIEESIKILKTNMILFEFRTTVVKGIHEIDDFIDIGRWIKGPYKYYLQNYKESEDVLAFKIKEKEKLQSFSKEELGKILEIFKKNLPNTEIR